MPRVGVSVAQAELPADVHVVAAAAVSVEGEALVAGDVVAWFHDGQFAGLLSRSSLLMAIPAASCQRSIVPLMKPSVWTMSRCRC